MCGITGFWDFKQELSPLEREQIIHKMHQQIEKRGPDSFGVWQDESKGIVLGHRRLAIVDLSELGHQPMFSKSGRMVIIYNGEIFNTDELRTELETTGLRFKSYSDTEVIVEACEHWGVKKAAQKFIGMFAFALWDLKDKQLYLVRDRIGIKPLYWGWQGDTFFFGSQIKSFTPHPHFKPSINENVLKGYFAFAYIRGEPSIFQGIERLKPGTILCLDSQKNLTHETFWSLEQVAEEGTRNQFSNPIETTEKLHELLKDSVKRRLVSDVPLGAFLSGGIDSSLVVGLMQSLSSRPTKTFSIGFDFDEFNEAPYAAAIAQHLGSDHTELIVTEKECLDIIPMLADYYDEPMADSSQIPTYAVSKLARQHVTVSLSGDGGDELFAGYDRYLIGQRLWTLFDKVPHILKPLARQAPNLIPTSILQVISRNFSSNVNFSIDKIERGKALLGAKDLKEFYNSLINVSINGNYLARGLDDIKAPNLETIPMMQFIDEMTYLPEDILAKVDRASMAVSLEARVPLLDHRVIEFSWRLPESMKVQDGKGKWILRQLLKKYVPENLFERPKKGFSIPLNLWLRGPLKAWAEDLLYDPTLNHYVNQKVLLKKWQEHQEGHHNWHYSLWPVLMFQLWRQRWGF